MLRVFLLGFGRFLDSRSRVVKVSSLLIMSGFVVHGFCVGPRFEWLLERASQRINIVEVKMEVIVEVVCFSFGGCRCGVGFVVLGLRCMGGGICFLDFEAKQQ
jgi:hypothetical protein